ncbi:hypothetical protein [Siphonobacter aquaeclarae]|jgi:hypothetical protein|uniref:Uncharacterized protein n=1 Tax=Siphonobacter aquaeclarae TaxID=563176 RepID=A0A1G9TGL7_9BACT|nr:hypothetical protein [Siphonobacter aquaeclarae]MBO9640648.1 hypothetical protein [Siphonobacter aquaeclarae]SDM46901.1 hypothetical protein SAMN04488090_3555 [Siphonobacter aquaeclarae]
MKTTFDLHESELDEKLLKSLKDLFRGKHLRLVVETVHPAQADIPPIPISSDRLSAAVEHVRKGENVKVLTFEDLHEIEKKIGL